MASNPDQNQQPVQEFRAIAKRRPVPKLKTPAKIGSHYKLLAKSVAIFIYAHESASSLVSAFNDAKAKRGGRRGVLTDLEQDILRAALVMSCAGLDATLKRAIRDCLKDLLEFDDHVRTEFERFIQKRISAREGQDDLVQGAKFLGVVLADKEPRARLIEEYIKELTGESLQSPDQVLRAMNALGLDWKELKIDIAQLKTIFSIRNQIIHELDMNLESKAFRKRRVRGQDDLLDNSDVILQTARTIIEAVNKKMAEALKALLY